MTSGIYVSAYQVFGKFAHVITRTFRFLSMSTNDFSVTADQYLDENSTHRDVMEIAVFAEGKDNNHRKTQKWTHWELNPAPPAG